MRLRPISEDGAEALQRAQPSPATTSRHSTYSAYLSLEVLSMRVGAPPRGARLALVFHRVDGSDSGLRSEGEGVCKSMTTLRAPCHE